MRNGNGQPTARPVRDRVSEPEPDDPCAGVGDRRGAGDGAEKAAAELRDRIKRLERKVFGLDAAVFLPPQPPPVAMTGALGWLRANLLSTPFNIALTIITALLLIWVIPELVKFLLIDAVQFFEAVADHYGDTGDPKNGCGRFTGYDGTFRGRDGSTYTDVSYVVEPACDRGEPGVGHDHIQICIGTSDPDACNAGSAPYRRNGILTGGNIQKHSL